MKIINFLKSNFLKLICINSVRPILLSENPTFLILMSQNIGDMIVCSPILRELKLAFPNSELQVIIKSVNKEMAEEAFRNASHKLPINTKLVERRPM